MYTDPTQKPKLIILIDDDIKFSIGMVALLKREGYEVVNSRNGKEALELLKNRKPDLILCDVMMPAPDGLELKQILNMDATLRITPFIFMSAKTGQSDREQALALGAADYILKPFAINELLRKIQQFLK